MPADQPPTRTVGCKMTDNEYERLSAVAEGDGMTLGERVREVLQALGTRVEGAGNEHQRATSGRKGTCRAWYRRRSRIRIRLLCGDHNQVLTTCLTARK
jgi:hypothetical protein